jgi:hypothetical protein
MGRLQVGKWVYHNPYFNEDVSLASSSGGDPNRMSNEDNLKYQFYFQPQNKPTKEIDHQFI